MKKGEKKMTESKYSKVLTIVLAVIVIAILVLLIIFGYDLYKKSSTKRQAEEIVDQFYNNIGSGKETEDENSVVEFDEEGNPILPVLNEEVTETTSRTTSKKKTTYQGYNVIGTIEIPTISLKYPILERVTKEAIETSVAVLQPSAGPNQVGNTTIVGHNYRNGSFFGSNKKLVKGDKIYITDESGTRIKYNIYHIYTTTPDDADYMTRNTNGKREVSLSTCTDNSKERLIIWAVEE